MTSAASHLNFHPALPPELQAQVRVNDLRLGPANDHHSCTAVACRHADFDIASWQTFIAAWTTTSRILMNFGIPFDESLNQPIGLKQEQLKHSCADDSREFGVLTKETPTRIPQMHTLA